MDPREHPTSAHVPPVAAPIEEMLREAIDAAAGFVDPAPLCSALAALADPWRIALVGRTSAGKSTLLNRATGGSRPVGLGGVTAGIEEIRVDGAVWVDTPGIDDPDEAVLALGPVLEGADAVIWVVDGLQPMTASERAVLAAVLPPSLPLWVVVSKLDLVEPDEHDAVVERAASLALPLGVRATAGLDLRRADAGVLAHLGRCAPPGPRRAARIRAAAAEVRRALDALPVPIGPEEIGERLRSEVRGLVRAFDARIDAGTLDDPHSVEEALQGALQEVILGVARSAEGLRLPPFEPAPRTRLGSIREGMSGAEGARRALKAAAARWLQGAEWILHDGWPGASAARARAAGHLRLSEALGRLQDAPDEPQSEVFAGK